MRQKIICLFLCIVLLLSITVIPSYAEGEPLENNDGSLVSVRIEWTDMSFTFNGGSWNETTHTYDGRGWTTSESGGNLTLANNGGVAIKARFSYVASEGFEDIGVDFLKEEQAVLTQNIDIDESVSVSVCPTGEPSEPFECVCIGTITVTITSGGEVTQ